MPDDTLVTQSPAFQAREKQNIQHRSLLRLQPPKTPLLQTHSRFTVSPRKKGKEGKGKKEREEEWAIPSLLLPN